MLAGTFAEQLQESATPSDKTMRGLAPSAVQQGNPSQSSDVNDEARSDDATDFDPTEFGNFSFDFGAAEPEEEESNPRSPFDSLANLGRSGQALDSNEALASEHSISARDDKTADGPDAAPDDGAASESASSDAQNAFPAPTVSTADVLKFLIDRTGYIKILEEEDTPEAYSRIENLHELVNAAMDSHDRAETLDQFLDHAALIADADDYDQRAQITLMSLHAAKGLEFPLVFLSGLEEGLFPHSRTMLVPEDIEEERRLCYVGMTRAMDQLILTRAVYRRRYGTDMPEASVPSRFLEEVPGALIEELGTRRSSGASLHRTGEGARPHTSSARYDSESSHYSYEDEDQSTAWHGNDASRNAARAAKQTVAAHAYNSIENIAEFFASRGKKFSVPKAPVEEPTGKRGFRPGQRVRHPKYGEGTVYQREGEGEEAKITVQFPRFGLKKLVEKYAQLERA
jgi:DNA helicase II / ATP-dependent DNA helicase PcrA